MQNTRKCIACGELKPRENLIKITKYYKDGKLYVNPDSKTFGRSAYLCYNQSCIEKALKKNRLAKMLKTNIGEDLKGQLINEQFKS